MTITQHRPPHPTGPTLAGPTPHAPTVAAPAVAAPAVAAPTVDAPADGDGDGYVLACAECEVTAGPYPCRGEAELLAGRHDTIHHHGALTATVAALNVCESCRHRPAVTTWHHPAAGAPFALCRTCAPTGEVRS